MNRKDLILDSWLSAPALQHYSKVPTDLLSNFLTAVPSTICASKDIVYQ